MVEAVLGALSDDPPVALKVASKRRIRRRPPVRKKVSLAAAK
jgi:hypothetical protein